MSGQHVQLPSPDARAAKPYKGIAMEGLIARWYARNRANDPELPQLVEQLHARLTPGAQVLEVAPGPGYLAIALAQRGEYNITGLDISASFVTIARAHAHAAGVTVAFQQGDAAHMPFAADTFDLVICCAAFKNFSEPIQAIQEMYRTLSPGGTAVILDLRGDATLGDIQRAVQAMGLSRINRQLTQWVFKYMLLKRAYTSAQMRQMVAQTAFAQANIHEEAISMQVWLEK